MSQNYYYSPGLKIVIPGRDKDTANYEKALADMGAYPTTTMDLSNLSGFDGLLLPGGGDITPAFFGQKNHGSRNIDVELDITQLQALDFFAKRKLPVLGICKGMQIINVYFGGTILQHIPEFSSHAWEGCDKIHPTSVLADSFLGKLYGGHMVTNSAHHQAVGRLGCGLRVVQTADDGIIEGISHGKLPVFGVQWHPERQFSPSGCCSPACGPADGRILFSYFLSLCTPRET